MAWTEIPDKSTGDLMDETWHDTHFKANMEYLKAQLEDFMGCKATRAANQAVSGTTQTTITLPTEDWDSDTMHDTGSNTERVAAPEDGYYLAVGTITHSGASSARVEIRDKNALQLGCGFGDGPGMPPTCAAIVYLPADDYVYLSVYCVNAGNVNPASLALVRIRST